MNLASVDPMDFAYLKTLSRFAEETQAMWASDRLAFCGLDDRIFPQTFPMPYSEELLSHVVSRIAVVRDILELPFLVENIATHAGTSCDTMFSNKKGRMSEVEFITQVLERADCRMFLNLTAFMITAMEQNANPVQLVAQLPLERLSALRICGHVVQSGFLVESDTAALSRELCDVLEAVIARLPNPVPIVWARDSSTGIPRSELSRISGMLEHNFARQSERGQDQGLET